MSSQPHSFLVFARDEGVATAVARRLTLYRRVRWIDSKTGDAWAALAAPLGIVVEASSDALDVLARIRGTFAYAPAVIIGHGLSTADVERAYMLRAAHLALDEECSGIMPFIFRCLTEEAVCDERVGCLVESLVRGGLLTSREAELLVLVLADIPRSEIPERMCISENTLKAHTRQLLRKLEASDLDKLAARVFRVALQSGGRSSWIPARGSGTQRAAKAQAEDLKTDNVVAITSVRRRQG